MFQIYSVWWAQSYVWCQEPEREMIAVAELQQIGIQSKKDVSYSCLLGQDVPDIFGLVGSKLCLVSRTGSLSKIPALARVRATKATASCKSHVVAAALKDGRVAIWSKGTGSAVVISGPPSLPPPSPMTADIGCCIVQPTRNKTVNGIFISNDGENILVLGLDYQVWLWHPDQTSGTSVWHRLPLDRLGIAREQRQPNSFDAVFCADSQRGRGVSLAFAFLNSDAPVPSLTVRMVEMTFHLSDEASPYVLEWAMNATPWVPSEKTVVLTKWDPRAKLVAVVLGEQDRGYVMLASPHVEAAVKIDLAAHSGMETFSPCAVAWTAGGALLALASQTGHLAVLTRFGTPLLLLNSRGGSPGPLLQILPAPVTPVLISGHNMRSGVVMWSGTMLSTINLPFKSGIDSFTAVASPTMCDGLFLPEQLSARTQCLLAVWQAAVSYSDPMAQRVASSVASTLTATGNWAAVVQALKVLPWDVEQRCQRLALGMVTEVCTQLIEAKRPLPAIFLLQEAEEHLQIVLKRLWERIALDFADGVDDAASRIAVRRLQQFRTDEPVEIPAEVTAAHKLWVQGSHSDAITAYGALGARGLLPCVSALLLTYDLNAALQLAELQTELQGKTLAVTGNRAVVLMVALAIAQYFRKQTVNVLPPTICTEIEEDDLLDTTLRHVSLDAGRLAEATTTVPGWSVHTAVQYFVALEKLSSALSLLADTDQRPAALKLALQHDPQRSGAYAVNALVTQCVRQQRFADALTAITAAQSAGYDTKPLRMEALRSGVTNVRQILTQISLLPGGAGDAAPTNASAAEQFEDLVKHCWNMATDAGAFALAYAKYLKTSTPESVVTVDGMDAAEIQLLRFLCRVIWCKRERDQLCRAVMSRSADVALRAVRMLPFDDIYSAVHLLEVALTLVDGSSVDEVVLRLFVNAIRGRTIVVAARPRFMRLVEIIRTRFPSLADDFEQAAGLPADTGSAVSGGWSCESEPRYIEFVKRTARSLPTRHREEVLPPVIVDSESNSVPNVRTTPPPPEAQQLQPESVGTTSSQRRRSSSMRAADGPRPDATGTRARVVSPGTTGSARKTDYSASAHSSHARRKSSSDLQQLKATSVTKRSQTVDDLALKARQMSTVSPANTIKLIRLGSIGPAESAPTEEQQSTPQAPASTNSTGSRRGVPSTRISPHPMTTTGRSRRASMIDRAITLAPSPAKMHKSPSATQLTNPVHSSEPVRGVSRSPSPLPQPSVESTVTTSALPASAATDDDIPSPPSAFKMMRVRRRSAPATTAAVRLDEEVAEATRRSSTGGEIPTRLLKLLRLPSQPQFFKPAAPRSLRMITIDSAEPHAIRVPTPLVATGSPHVDSPHPDAIVPAAIGVPDGSRDPSVQPHDISTPHSPKAPLSSAPPSPLAERIVGTSPMGSMMKRRSSWRDAIDRSLGSPSPNSRAASPSGSSPAGRSSTNSPVPVPALPLLPLEHIMPESPKSSRVGSTQRTGLSLHSAPSPKLTVSSPNDEPVSRGTSPIAFSAPQSPHVFPQPASLSPSATPVSMNLTPLSIVGTAERSQYQQPLPRPRMFAPPMSGAMTLQLQTETGPRQFLSVMDLDADNFTSMLQPIVDPSIDSLTNVSSGPALGVLVGLGARPDDAPLREKLAGISDRLKQVETQADELEKDFEDAREMFDLDPVVRGSKRHQTKINTFLHRATKLEQRADATTFDRERAMLKTVQPKKSVGTKGPKRTARARTP
eukprot:TRINITY_DN9438_c0_g1_i1.p1 TRINITY_DN9438_c0_g1~~TRINITY_DN9438_c0_g1_i1.p1  ORF type:complete len:1728 (+),score=396.86 TRINITY_DN9438_c0_g1_i1:110-5293(+)